MKKLVFREYTAQQLDRQYNARLAVPGHEEIFKDWRALSADYCQQSVCQLDVAYGPGELETLDLFIPEQTNAPLHIFMHGGYWRAMDKSDFSYLAGPLVDKGALVAVVNYGLCPSVTMDEITRQMRAACKWLRQNCHKYGGNPGDIHVSGHSAGGQLAGMLMATDWPSFFPDLPHDLIKSGVSVSGIFDLEPMLYIPLNEDLKLDKASAHRNSPIFMNPVTGASLSIVVGGQESDEFHRQSYSFAEKWRERGAKTEYVDLPGLNHFTILDQMKKPDNPLTEIMLRHMGLL